MQINYIREFIVLAETCNFLEASEQLFISQSSLSMHIKSLEKEIGAPLFNRTTRKVELNELGTLFLPYAKQIVHAQDEFSTVFFNQHEKSKKTVNIGSIPSMVQYNITDIFAKFKKDNQNFIVNVFQTESDILEDMLRQDKCDLAFIRQVKDPKNEFVKLAYTADTLAAVLPLGHPMTNRKSISLEELKDEEFLLLPKNTRPYNLCMEACQQRGFTPRVTFTDRQLENVMDLVSKEMGISLLMKKLAMYLDNKEVAIVDITPPISTQICLCYKKGHELTAAAKHFLNYFKSLQLTS